jgi:hypothetical protein
MSNNHDSAEEKIDKWIAGMFPITLDPSRVPVRFKHLIPLAETWGITDDLIRHTLLKRASNETLEALERDVRPYISALQLEWLSNDEVYGTSISDEYMAFSYMIRATDEAKIILERRKEKNKQ